jgi:hypothetical protein
LKNQIERINEIITHPKLYLQHKQTLVNIHNSIIAMIEDYPSLSLMSIKNQVISQTLDEDVIINYRNQMIAELRKFTKTHKDKLSDDDKRTIVNELTEENNKLEAKITTTINTTKLIVPSLEFEDDLIFEELDEYVLKMNKYKSIPKINQLSRSEMRTIQNYYTTKDIISDYYQELIDDVETYEQTMVAFNIKLMSLIDKELLDNIYTQHVNDCKIAIVNATPKKSQQQWFHDKVGKFIDGLLKLSTK